jgi:ferrochelatase
MPFRPEAPAVETNQERTAVLWCNLGSPDEPTAAAVRPYLADFLGDPRVVEIPRALWALILHGIILRTRPAKSAAKYASIWTPEGSPLKVWTQKQAKLLAGWLGERGHRVAVREAMRYGSPSIAAQLDALKAEGATRVLVLQAYPQYSATTTASVIDAVNAWSARVRRLPEFRFVNQYHDEPLYIEALAQSALRYWKDHGRPEQLLMSFHGIPERNIRQGDPYQAQCLAIPRHFPIALRPREVARALHRAEPARDGCGGRRACRRDVPRLSGRLPGDAGGDRDGRPRGIPARGREGLPLHPLPQRQQRVDHGAGGDRGASPRRLADPLSMSLSQKRPR